ncbi:hypothetical protein MAR_033511 [Mya arenaria]|uniref:Uncharacterized protein n=1 Tax=Mya arenaria TaxID=6604 RepID=A0ABY7GCA3_MYAAR|nr:hypothetical protein MAR_033511 [Mya arenaria]
MDTGSFVFLDKLIDYAKKENRVCSPLSDCLPSESKLNLLFNAAVGLQITYIVLHGVTILLVTISQQREYYSDEPDVRKCCNGMIIFLAAAISYIGIIVFLSGVIQLPSFKGGPPRLSINLAMISLETQRL